MLSNHYNGQTIETMDETGIMSSICVVALLFKCARKIFENFQGDSKSNQQMGTSLLCLILSRYAVW